MKDDAIYSKTRFHELVKLYHPDMSPGKSEDIPRQVKIERYRLIVAAHTILSDPTRRSAYDRFGAGWNGKADLGGRQTAYSDAGVLVLVAEHAIILAAENVSSSLLQSQGLAVSW